MTTRMVLPSLRRTQVWMWQRQASSAGVRKSGASQSWLRRQVSSSLSRMMKWAVRMGPDRTGMTSGRHADPGAWFCYVDADVQIEVRTRTGSSMA
ncbi:hypothetical protein [Streptomyces sp. NPDC056160]|uniref:hypothetical protein n=1 Tax=Streptomyces sp. NPDC056160 TaxID=3345731 RepID=UPI0035E077B7